MHRHFSMMLALLLLAAVSQAQEREPRPYEVAAGYSYFNSFKYSGAGLHGATLSLDPSITRWFGLHSEVSGGFNQASSSGVTVTARTAMFGGGPQFSLRSQNVTVFARGLIDGVLIGGGFSSPYGSGSANQWGGAIGGGAGVNGYFSSTTRVGVQVAFDTAKMVGFPGYNPTVWRATAGIVYRSRPRAASATNVAPTTASSVQVTNPAAVEHAFKLVGISGDLNPYYGLRVVAVTAGSPAARAGIAVNDFIVAVDGKRITNESEFATAVLNAPGKLTLGINKPAWLSTQVAQVVVTLN